MNAVSIKYRYRWTSCVIVRIVCRYQVISLATDRWSSYCRCVATTFSTRHLANRLTITTR